MSNATGKPLVSVIIPVFNEEKNISTCLESLQNQTYQKIEIIVVNDCSTDRTIDVVKKIKNTSGLNIKTVNMDRHKERGIARNTGAAYSKGSYLLFIDADMKLDKNVVKECVELINKDGEVKAVIISELSFGEGFWAKCRNLEKRCYIGDDVIEAARFFDKKAFDEVGGWDEKMVSGEDWDLTRRIRSKHKIGRIKSFIYHNEHDLTLWKAVKKKFYYASVSETYLAKNPINFSTFIFFILRPAYVRNWKLIVSSPHYGIGMFLLKGAEITAGAAGFLYAKLKHLL